MKSLFFYVVLFSISISFVHAQNSFITPISSNRHDFTLVEGITNTVSWEPAPIDVTLGSYNLTVWFLQPEVPAPFAGYFLTKNDWVEIRRKLKSSQAEIERVKNKERDTCDNLLKERDTKCKELNDNLLKTVDLLKEERSNLNKSIKDLKDNYFWFKVGSSIIVTGLSSYTIYQLVAK
tara:strand:- start:417 stop:950 length:534 start_codon:yes stop_codon:yes gene_type:complete